MAFGTRMFFDPVRELDASSITTNFSALGVPFSDHARIVTISNSTGEEIYISFDGIDPHLRLAGNSFKLLDISANKIRDDGLFISSGTQIYVRFVGTTSITGAVWAEVMFGEGGK